MGAPTDTALTALLLELGRTVVLQLDRGLQLTAVRNEALLGEWREGAMRHGDRPATLQSLLAELMAPLRARDLGARIAAAARDSTAPSLYLGVAPLTVLRGGGSGRSVALSLHHAAAGEGTWLVLRDLSALSDAQQLLADTQVALDSAMAALRAPAHALRLFLSSALASISAIRAALRLPARDTATLRDKLVRLHAATAQLAGEAGALSVAPIQDACHALLHAVMSLQDQPQLTGDALLPLAVLVDRIAAAAGVLWRIEEQRHIDAQAARQRARRQPDWAFASERRWSSFLRHRSEELGVLVTLQMQGATQVPKSLRASVDGLLQHLLRTAVEHGIETPEERLQACKPAAATVRVAFSMPQPSQLRMTVHDDGRGRGPGLTSVRRAMARVGGQVAVAAKPGQYTEFTIDLPVDAGQKAVALVAAT